MRPLAMTPKDISPLIYDCLGLVVSESTSLHDAVLISVDFENINDLASPTQSKTASRQMGVAILDTRELQASFCDIIATYNFASGPSQYLTAARGKFIFGETITVKQQDLIASLQSLIPSSRNIVLVSHGITNELHAFKLLNFDSSIFNGFLDTFSLSQYIIPLAPDRSLRGLLEFLRIPYCNLHSAGTDAHFTMRCLLLLAIKGFQEHEGTSEASEQRVQRLSQIAMSALPDVPGRAPTKQEKKKAKRFQRKRKHQAKGWDTATQDLIRAERAAKRDSAESHSIT
jgi:hypothetical protein